MEHPYRPLRAYKNFRKKIYKDRFAFKTKHNFNDQILHETSDIKNIISNATNKIDKNLANQTIQICENVELLKENNALLKTSDFSFEIRNTSNIIIADVMNEFFICKESEPVLCDFLLRKRHTGKIIFEKKVTNGISVRFALDFFNKYTDLLDKCKSDEEQSQADTYKIINDIILCKKTDGENEENPIKKQAFSNYMQKTLLLVKKS